MLPALAGAKCRIANLGAETRPMLCTLVLKPRSAGARVTCPEAETPNMPKQSAPTSATRNSFTCSPHRHRRVSAEVIEDTYTPSEVGHGILCCFDLQRPRALIRKPSPICVTWLKNLHPPCKAHQERKCAIPRHETYAQSCGLNRKPKTEHQLSMLNHRAKTPWTGSETSTSAS